MRYVMIAAALLMVVAPATAQTQRREIHGARAKVQVGSTIRHDGEMIAVSSDSVWVKVANTVLGVPMSSVTKIYVERQPNARSTKKLMIFGLVTGVVMTASCLSLEDTTSCPMALIGSLAASGLVALISNVGMDHIRFTSIPLDPDQLRPWARFPQGLPPGTVTNSGTEQPKRKPPP